MKLLPFVMPGYPDLRTSRDVVHFLQTQNDVIIETALPSRQPSGSAMVQKVRQTVLRAGISPEDVSSTFRAERKKLPAMLMLHQEPDGHTLSQIHASFDYAIAPFAAGQVAALNASAAIRQEAKDPFTRFGAQTSSDDAELEAKVKASEGFIYLKVAAEREGQLLGKEKIHDAIQKIKAVKDIDVFCGFGIKSADDVRMLKTAGADGAFLGAETLHAQEKGPHAFKSFWQSIQAAAEA